MNGYNEPFSLKGSAISDSVNKRACALLVTVDELIFWHLFFLLKKMSSAFLLREKMSFKHNKDKKTSHTCPNPQGRPLKKTPNRNTRKLHRNKRRSP
jgi:hypothetical protein